MPRNLNIIAIFIILILCTIIFCYSSTNVKAKTGDFIYVGGTGLGKYSSIQDAIDNSNHSDTIIVFAGNYSENLIINKSINLLGLDKNNVTIYGNNGLYSLLIKSPNITISGFTITKSNVGILLSGLDYNFCNIKNNIISNNNEAIRLINSSNNNISENIIKQNLNFGIVLYESKFNIIYNNTFIENNKAINLRRWSNYNEISKNNLTSYNYGFNLDFSFFNNITENLITNGDYGIYLTSSKNNNVSFNYIGNNREIGIYTSSSDENFIGSNIFLNNNQDFSKKTKPPNIQTPGFELLLVLLSIIFITFVKKYK